MHRLAEHILAYARENNISVTNLQLQKSMFFSLGLHLKQAGQIDNLARELYRANQFSKWKYGPVVEDIYFEYNHLGRSPITEHGFEIQDDLNHLNTIIRNCLEYDVYKLVEVSHQMPAWRNHEERILNGDYVEPYTLEEIYEDFINVE